MKSIEFERVLWIGGQAKIEVNITDFPQEISAAEILETA